MLPAHLRLGVATAAHQVEGGTTANNWTRWELTGRPDGSPAIRSGDRCGQAAEHWRRFDTDLALLRWLGVSVYHFSIEWSRIEPLPGYIDASALAAYRRRCLDLRAAGITPLVTLHHFTEPDWTCDRGGFAHPDTASAWLRFVALVVERLGDVVRHWVTIHEPVTYATRGWWEGSWPPGEKDARLAARTLENLLLAHAEAYRLIHRRDGAGRTHQVGMTHAVVPLLPRVGWHPIDQRAFRTLTTTHNWAVPQALRTGILALRVPGGRWVTRHPGLRDTQDFLGISPAPRPWVQARPGHLSSSGRSLTDGERDDSGVLLEPGALGPALDRAAQYGLPLVILGQGVSDHDDPDLRRRRFLGATLAEVAAAIGRGANVQAYLYWSLLDGFAWDQGFAAAHGLFRVDRRALTRRPTSTAELYRSIIAARRRARQPGDPSERPFREGPPDAQ